MFPIVLFGGLAAVAVIGIRFLIRHSTDRTTLNSSGAKFRAHDSTVSAYERQGLEMAREMDDEVEGLPAITQRQERTEAQESQPETRTGA